MIVFNALRGTQSKVRTLRRIKFRRKELIIKLEAKHIAGGEHVNIRIAKHLTKRMRKNWVVVQILGKEVLRIQIPEEMDRAFQCELPIE